ncbi:MAG TPA: tetratricopeptide repeat protein, partial [Nitrospirae bacterium]|nr:tetratricopeptide repeat protein [Nitrospirota bacterium]
MKGRILVLDKKLILLAILVTCILMSAPLIAVQAEEAAVPSGDVERTGLREDIDGLLERRAELGLKNLEPQSVFLIKKGEQAYKQKREKEAIKLFEQARELSPDLPLSYLYLAKAHFSLSPKKLYKASGYLLGAWRALLNNFWWSFQTAGMFILSLFISLHVSVIIFLVVLMTSKLSLYVHDIIEDKRKILLLIAPVLFALFGPIFGVIGFILPFWVYLKEKEKIVLYSAVGISFIIILMFPVFSSFTGASQDRTLRSVIKINEGIFTGESQEISTTRDDYEALFSRALELKRRGRYDEAISIYNELLKIKSDARVYNNLANCYVGLGRYDTASGYYNQALESAEMASASYNLSQLYREVFDFSDAEEYYDRAVRADARKVALYSSIKGMSVNRFVMDETLENRELWSLAFKWYPYYSSSVSLGRMQSFTGRGASIFLLVILMAVLHVYKSKVSRWAYRCRRCGEIYCSACEKRISHEDVCLTCFKTLVQVSELGPKERVERILEIQHYRDDKNQRLKLLTAILPGSGHIYYGRTVYGFVTLA